MTGNLFDNAKFGDIFFTTENKQAVFLRFSENTEYKFAILYVEGWGKVQVFRHNGKEIYNDAAHSIISKQEEPVSDDLEAEIQRYKDSHDYMSEYIRDVARHFAKWQKQQDQSTIELAEDHAMLAGMNIMEQQMMAKAIDAHCFGFQGSALFSFELPADNYLVGSKVKVIVIRETEL